MAYPPLLVVLLLGSYLGLLPPGPSIQVLKSISMTIEKHIRRFLFAWSYSVPFCLVNTSNWPPLAASATQVNCDLWRYSSMLITKSVGWRKKLHIHSRK